MAFKKQRVVSPEHYGLSASIATSFMDVVCTSGVKTGSAPDLEKIKSIRQGCGRDRVLAIASGITPENVIDFLPYANCLLVATGTIPPSLLIIFMNTKFILLYILY